MENQQKRFVLNMLGYAVQRNISAEQLSHLAGIETYLKKKDDKTALTAKQFNDLWTNAVYLSHDPLFGLHFGESLQLGALGIVGSIIQTSSTVGEALTHAGAMTHLITDAFGLEVIQSNKTFTIKFVTYPEKEQAMLSGFSQMMDFFMALLVREMDGLMLEKIKPMAVRYPYTVSDLSEYERVLRCRPVKRAKEYSVEFDLSYWNAEIITANYELQEILLKKVSAALTKREGPLSGNDGSLPVRIYNYLLTNSYLGISSLEDIAANFNTSPRNLQRKLKEDGVKYQDLADEVRKSLSVHYLSSGNYRIKDIAHMLGYNELSAFTRAFKRWTGASPGNYVQPDKFAYDQS